MAADSNRLATPNTQPAGLKWQPLRVSGSLREIAKHLEASAIPLAGAWEWWDHTGQARARRANDVREGRSPDARFDVLTYFFHDVPQQVVEAAFAQGEPRQSDAIFSSPLKIDAWPEVPMRVLIGRDDRCFPRDFQRRVAAERLSIAGDEIPGGHLVALSHPVELAEQLTLYARELVVAREPLPSERAT